MEDWLRIWLEVDAIEHTTVNSAVCIVSETELQEEGMGIRQVFSNH